MTTTEREAPFVVRLPGRRVTATCFHLYPDCGVVADMLRGDWEAIPLNGEFGRQLVNSLALHPCGACCKRRDKRTAADVIATALDAPQWSADGIMLALDRAGFKVVPKVERPRRWDAGAGNYHRADCDDRNCNGGC